jgi:hypothetical protein
MYHFASPPPRSPPQAVNEISCHSTSLPAFLILAILASVEWHLIVLICIFLMKYDVEHLSPHVSVCRAGFVSQCLAQYVDTNRYSTNVWEMNEWKPINQTPTSLKPLSGKLTKTSLNITISSRSFNKAQTLTIEKEKNPESESSLLGLISPNQSNFVLISFVISEVTQILWSSGSSCMDLWMYVVTGIRDVLLNTDCGCIK